MKSAQSQALGFRVYYGSLSRDLKKGSIRATIRILYYGGHIRGPAISVFGVDSGCKGSASGFQGFAGFRFA